MYGYNSYGSRGSSSLLSGIGSLGNLNSVTGVLVLVAFVAAIVLTVLGYRKFIAKKDGTKRNLKEEDVWRKFLRFDTLLIEKILQALYLFNALFIAFFGVAVILGSLSSGVGGFLVMLISQVFLVALFELLNRFVYEAMMLGFITARNTIEIRDILKGKEKIGAPGIVSPSPAPTPAAPVAPAVAEEPVVSAAPEPPVAPAAPEAPEASGDSTTVIPEGAVVVEPDAATEGFSGSFCPHCGAEAAPGSRFCGNCGMPLE